MLFFFCPELEFKFYGSKGSFPCKIHYIFHEYDELDGRIIMYAHEKKRPIAHSMRPHYPHMRKVAKMLVNAT